MRSIIQFILCVYLVLAAPAGWAQTITLQDAQAALFTKNYELAKANEQAYPIDSALIYARASLELGQFSESRRALDIAKKRAPQLEQVRVLYGLWHLAQNQPRRAMIHLRRALDLAGSPQERQGVVQLLRQVQSTLRFGFTSGVALAPSSNINKITTATTVTLINGLGGGTVEADYDPGATVESGVGLKYWLGLSYRIPTQNHGQFSLNVQRIWDNYKDNEFDRETSSVSAAWQLPVNARNQRATLTYNTPYLNRIMHLFRAPMRIPTATNTHLPLRLKILAAVF